MKVAFVAEDEQTISAHFGRAPYVVVVDVVDGQPAGRELREKAGHGGHGHSHDHASANAGGINVTLDAHDHGHDHEDDHEHHHHDHSGMFASMQDCDVMIVRGIGSPALTHAQNQGLDVYLTGEKTVDAALARLLAGTLDNDEWRIHHH